MSERVGWRSWRVGGRIRRRGPRLGDEGAINDEGATLVVQVVQPERGVLRAHVDCHTRR